MRKRLTLTIALGAMVALAVAGVAHAYKPVVVKAGNLVLTFNGGITPTKLPKNKMAPITLNVSGGIATADGSHPPALKEFVIETDKNGGINAKGLPTCKAGKIEATTTTSAEKACKSGCSSPNRRRFRSRASCSPSTAGFPAARRRCSSTRT
jgi:hypothetical protein